MTKKYTFREMFNSARTTSAYKVEGVILEITEQIVEKMNAFGISNAELASRINVSAPYITKLLRGETNFTAESMVKVANAFDCDVEVKFVPRASANEWIELFDKTLEPKREFHVWAQIKHDSQNMRSNRGGLQCVQSPYDETFYHVSR